MATFKEALQYAQQNPTSDFAKTFEAGIKAGQFTEPAKAEGIDLTPYIQPSQGTMSRVETSQAEPEGVKGVGGALLGAAKGAGQLVTGLGKVIGKAVTGTTANTLQSGEDALKKALPGNNFVQGLPEVKNVVNQGIEQAATAGGLLNEENLKANGTAEKVGKTVFDVASIFAQPELAVDKLGVKGLTHLAETGALSPQLFAKLSGAIESKFGQVVEKGIAHFVNGAAYGGSQAVATGSETPVKDALTAGAVNTVAAPIAGSILGKAKELINPALRAEKKAVSKLDDALEAITPSARELTPTEYENLLNKGKITPKTATEEAKYILSDEEKMIADKYKNILSNKDPVINHSKVVDEIIQKDKEVGAFLKGRGTFNNGELRNSLNQKLTEITDVTVDETRLQKMKDNLINNFIKDLPKNDYENLWKARKEFDQKIERVFSGAPTLQNETKKAFRNAVQDFIAERTPEGVYKGYMKDMSQLFNIRDVIATKAVKEKGANAIQDWLKKNPTKAKVLGYGAGGAVSYGLGKITGILP